MVRGLLSSSYLCDESSLQRFTNQAEETNKRNGISRGRFWQSDYRAWNRSQLWIVTTVWYRVWNHVDGRDTGMADNIKSRTDTSIRLNLLANLAINKRTIVLRPEKCATQCKYDRILGPVWSSLSISGPSASTALGQGSKSWNLNRDDYN